MRIRKKAQYKKRQRAADARSRRRYSIPVWDFGVELGNGIRDDSAEIQAAIDAGYIIRRPLCVPFF